VETEEVAPMARRVRAPGLQANPIRREKIKEIFSFVAPCQPALAEKTASFRIFRQALTK
jgi:hypothetical protein